MHEQLSLAQDANTHPPGGMKDGEGQVVHDTVGMAAVVAMQLDADSKAFDTQVKVGTVGALDAHVVRYVTVAVVAVIQRPVMQGGCTVGVCTQAGSMCWAQRSKHGPHSRAADTLHATVRQTSSFISTYLYDRAATHLLCSSVLRQKDEWPARRVRRPPLHRSTMRISTEAQIFIFKT